MGHSPKEKSNKNMKSSQVDYAVESSLPCWPRVPFAYAPINKLMIFAKVEKQHTKQSNKQMVS